MAPKQKQTTGASSSRARRTSASWSRAATIVDAAPANVQPEVHAPEHRVPIATREQLTIHALQSMLRRMHSLHSFTEAIARHLNVPEDRIVPVQPFDELEQAFLQLDNNEQGPQDVPAPQDVVSEDSNSEEGDDMEEDEDEAASDVSEEEL